MKTLLKIYLWITYIVALPLFLVFSAIILIWDSIVSLKEFGELGIMDSLKAYAEGIVIGHKINMARIEDIYSDDEGYHEEGV